MSTDKFVAQKATDCWLCHFHKEEAEKFNPFLFDIRIKARSKLTEEIILSTLIIGESHIFMAEVKGKIVFVELLSCVNPQEKGIIAGKILSLSNGNAIILSNGINSCAGIQEIVEPASRNLFEPENETGKPVKDLWIEYVFPGATTPRTVIKVWLEKNTVIVGTLHEYETLDQQRIQPLTSTTKVDIGWLLNL